MMKLVDRLLQRAMRWRARVHYRQYKARQEAQTQLWRLKTDTKFLDRWDAHDPKAEKLLTKLEWQAGYR